MSAGFDWWEPVVWEFSSAAVLFALVPAQLAFERRFPFRSDRWRRVLPWHLLATVPYSLIHVLGMVGLRQVAYDAVGEVYRFGYWPTGLLYEYLKDVRTYALVLGLVYLACCCCDCRARPGCSVRRIRDLRSSPSNARSVSSSVSSARSSWFPPGTSSGS